MNQEYRSLSYIFTFPKEEQRNSASSEPAHLGCFGVQAPTLRRLSSVGYWERLGGLSERMEAGGRLVEELRQSFFSDDNSHLFPG